MISATSQSTLEMLLDGDCLPVSLKIGSCRQEMIDRFEEFASNNPSLHLEQTAGGEVIVMLPTGGRTSVRNTEITKQVANWATRNGGFVFDSQSLFRLPNGAKRGPDCAWVRADRWTSLSDEEQESYPPLAPDLAIELRSKTDRLVALQTKMEEYAANGVRLGWLIDPFERQVYVYRPQKSVIQLREPQELDGEDVALGLKLDLTLIYA